MGGSPSSRCIIRRSPPGGAKRGQGQPKQSLEIAAHSGPGKQAKGDFVSGQQARRALSERSIPSFLWGFSVPSGSSRGASSNCGSVTGGPWLR